MLRSIGRRSVAACLAVLPLAAVLLVGCAKKEEAPPPPPGPNGPKTAIPGNTGGSKPGQPSPD
ncbi:MAG: hypothetical protein ACP5VE_04845 [Chthonomonadales bacterium]